jgi:hypothetical protein
MPFVVPKMSDYASRTVEDTHRWEHPQSLIENTIIELGRSMDELRERIFTPGTESAMTYPHRPVMPLVNTTG